MFNITKKLIAEIKSATENGRITWYNVEGYLCCETTFKGKKYMTCIYPLESDNEFDVSLNLLNQYNNTVRPFREFSKGQEFYDEILELAILVWEVKKPATA